MYYVLWVDFFFWGQYYGVDEISHVCNVIIIQETSGKCLAIIPEIVYNGKCSRRGRHRRLHRHQRSGGHDIWIRSHYCCIRYPRPVLPRQFPLPNTTLVTEA